MVDMRGGPLGLRHKVNGPLTLESIAQHYEKAYKLAPGTLTVKWVNQEFGTYEVSGLPYGKPALVQ